MWNIMKTNTNNDKKLGFNVHRKQLDEDRLSQAAEIIITKTDIGKLGGTMYNGQMTTECPRLLR